eukprot:355495-Chlamydomonas_euryale.AAC.1
MLHVPVPEIEPDRKARRCKVTPEGAAVPLLKPYASTGLKAALRDAFLTNFPVVSVLQLAWVSVRIMNRLQPGYHRSTHGSHRCACQ